MTAPQLGSLLTLLGIGPSALALVQGYFKLSLLDPYGVGLLVGVLANIAVRYYGTRAETITIRKLETEPIQVEEFVKEVTPSFASVVTATASASPQHRLTQNRVALVFDRELTIRSKNIVKTYEVRSGAVRMWLEPALVGGSLDEKSARWIVICSSHRALDRVHQYETNFNHRAIAYAVSTARSGWWIEVDPADVVELLPL